MCARVTSRLPTGGTSTAVRCMHLDCYPLYAPRFLVAVFAKSKRVFCHNFTRVFLACCAMAIQSGVK